MKKQMVLFSLLLLALAPLALAQGDPPMVRVVTVHTDLAHSQDFEEGMKKLAKIAAKQENRDLAFVGSLVTQPGSYDLVFPLTSLEDIAKQEERGTKLFAEMGEAAGKMLAAAKSFDSSVYRWRSDLSFSPATPRVADSDTGYTRIVTLYPHPAKAAAVEALIKKGSEIRKKHGINDAIGAYQMILGADGPAYVLLIGAKNEADFYANQAKTMEKMSEDWGQLMAESGPLLRKVSYSSSVPRPDLMAGGM